MSLRSSFRTVRPARAEVVGARPGDEVVPRPDLAMDRAFTLAARPEVVWPWLVQLGKDRAGWYLPASAERWIPRSRRAVRRIEPRWQGLAVGDVIPDWGGRDATFEVASIEPARSLVYRSRRGRMQLSWALNLSPTTSGESTRVHLRLRAAPVRRAWLGRVGDRFDLVTVAGLAAGLAERLEETRPA